MKLIVKKKSQKTNMLNQKTHPINMTPRLSGIKIITFKVTESI